MNSKKKMKLSCLFLSIYASSYYYICVLILIYVCPYTAIVFSYCYICVLILLYMCPHTAIDVSSYYACVLICVLMLQHILLYMYPHTAIYVSSYYSVCVLICVLMLQHMCPHEICMCLKKIMKCVSFCLSAYNKTNLNVFLSV